MHQAGLRCVLPNVEEEHGDMIEAGARSICEQLGPTLLSGLPGCADLQACMTDAIPTPVLTCPLVLILPAQIRPSLPKLS